MHAPLLEITILASFHPDNARLAREACNQVDGLQRAYIGQEIENPSQGYCALQWESLRARDAFLRSPAYEAHTQHLTVQRGPFLITLSDDDHAACDAIFAAPVQKFGFLQASTPLAREKARDLFAHMRFGRQERAAKNETMGELDAAVVDNADCRVIMDGWESVEKHHAYAGRAENKSAMADIIAVLEWASSKHAKEVVA
ncbi:hypothetical protein GGF50DRAFT_128273 [Schizophyllum commune]